MPVHASADHGLFGRVPASLSSKTSEPSESPQSPQTRRHHPFHELTVHTSALPPGVALHLSNGHPFQIVEYTPVEAHASGILGAAENLASHAAADVGGNPYLRHWGKYGGKSTTTQGRMTSRAHDCARRVCGRLVGGRETSLLGRW